jgi:hypothetical protein
MLVLKMFCDTPLPHFPRRAYYIYFSCFFLCILYILDVIRTVTTHSPSLAKQRPHILLSHLVLFVQYRAIISM